jgi:5-(carboxyamino)imidazole ribonucleotide mutase
MGSESDWNIMKHSSDCLTSFGIAHETRVVSAHRTPDEMFQYSEQAEGRGIKIIIAGAGGSAHLPGMIASKTPIPVLGVPVTTKSMNGLDSLLSIVQMPKGIPVATFAVGEAGATNAALFATSALAANDEALSGKLAAFRKRQRAKVRAMKLPVKSSK